MCGKQNLFQSVRIHLSISLHSFKICRLNQKTNDYEVYRSAFFSVMPLESFLHRDAELQRLELTSKTRARVPTLRAKSALGFDKDEEKLFLPELTNENISLFSIFFVMPLPFGKTPRNFTLPRVMMNLVREKRLFPDAGDEEYRTEESMPMLAKILSQKHGFECKVLFAWDNEGKYIDPNNQQGVRGWHHFEDADLMLISTRFRRPS